MSKGDNIQGEPCYVKAANENVWTADSSKTWDTAVHGQVDSHPVSCVTWNDAVKFAEWLTANNAGGFTCTLPTAAQWEYASRGTETPCSNSHPDNFNTIVTSEIPDKACTPPDTASG